MIIWLNGSINSGKSTIAKMLAKKIDNPAVIEPDKFHEFIAWMDISEAVPLILKNTVCVTKNFVEKDLNVIISYPLSEKNYTYINPQFEKMNVQVKYFTLAPKIKEALRNRGDRKLNDWEKQRIKYHYKIKIHKPNFGEIIDNSKQNSEETTQEILDKLKK